MKHRALTQRNVAFARLAWGVALGAGVSAARATPTTRTVAAVLAARHVVQSMLTLGYPQSAAARWGWLADAGHAGTALLAGSLSSRWRRVALSDAAIAATWAGIAALPPQAGRFRPSRR